MIFPPSPSLSKFLIATTSSVVKYLTPQQREQEQQLSPIDFKNKTGNCLSNGVNATARKSLKHCTFDFSSLSKSTAAGEGKFRANKPVKRHISFSTISTFLILTMPIFVIFTFMISVLFILSRESVDVKVVDISQLLGDFAPSDRVVRLPHDFIPHLYELNLHVFLPYKEGVDFGVHNFTVHGHLKLHLECVRKTAQIKLNAKNLKIDYTRLRIFPDRRGKMLNYTDSMGDGPRVISVRYNPHSTVLELRTSVPLHSKFNYTLTIHYTALINRFHDGGLFMAPYKAQNGKLRIIAASHMQPLDARRLFPCFDQPDFKARFVLRVRYPRGLTAVSNMDVHHHYDNGNWSVSEFKKTPKMSTYLLALALVDFPYKEAIYKHQTIRIWMQESLLPHIDYALHVAIQSMEYFENYFTIPYPMKKLDIMGLPFLRVAAMENWGLIFCQQEALSYSPNVHGSRHRQQINHLLSHEIAHMWFGNLVTMEWWDDLWLNEGFATIMAMKAADHAEKREKLFEHTVKALRYEQTPSEAHPLSHPADTFQEIKRHFNRITYLKAASVLRMIEGAVGPRLFQKGLQIFLQKFAYGSAKASDLLNTLSRTLEENDPNRIRYVIPSSNNFGNTSLTATENLSLINLMDEWIYCAGFPLVRLSNIDHSNEKQTGNIIISQNSTKKEDHQMNMFIRQTPFFTNQIFNETGVVIHNNKRGSQLSWKVPLFLDSDCEKIFWMTMENSSVHLDLCDFIDADSYGYYRVQYDSYEKVLEILAQNHSRLTSTGRARLLEDTFTLARLGMVPFETAFRLSSYLVNETEYMPFIIFHGHMDRLYLLFRHGYPDAEILREYAIRMMKPIYHKVISRQLMSSPLIIEKFREFANQLCSWEYTPCVKKALAEFAKLKQSCDNYELSNISCNGIPPELRLSVYETAIRHGGANEFIFLEKKFWLETFYAERLRILNALAATTNLTMVNYTLYNIVTRPRHSSGIVEMIDPSEMFGRFTKSPILIEITDYLLSNFNRLVQKFSILHVLKILCNYAAKWMHSAEHLERWSTFENTHGEQLNAYKIQLSALRAEIEQNKNFMKKNAKTIIRILRKNLANND